MNIEKFALVLNEYNQELASINAINSERQNSDSTKTGHIQLTELEKKILEDHFISINLINLGPDYEKLKESIEKSFSNNPNVRKNITDYYFLKKKNLIDRIEASLKISSPGVILPRRSLSKTSNSIPADWIKFGSDDAIESPLANQSSQLIKIKTSGRENLCGYHALANVLSMMPSKDRFAGYENIGLDDIKARLLYENVVNEMPNLESSGGADVKTRGHIFDEITHLKEVFNQDPEANKDAVIKFFVEQFSSSGEIETYNRETINKRWHQDKQKMIDEFFDDKFQKEAKTDFTLAEFKDIKQDYEKAQRTGNYLEVLDQVKPTHAFEKDKIQGLRDAQEAVRLVITPGYNQKLIGGFLHQKWDNEWKKILSQSPSLTPSITAEMMESTNISAESLKIIANKINPRFELLGQNFINNQYQDPHYQPRPPEGNEIQLYISNNYSDHYTAMTPLSQYQDRLAELGLDSNVSVYPDKPRAIGDLEGVNQVVKTLIPASPSSLSASLTVTSSPQLSDPSSLKRSELEIQALCDNINNQTKLQVLLADLGDKQEKGISISNIDAFYLVLYKDGNDYGIKMSYQDQSTQNQTYNSSVKPTDVKISLSQKQVDLTSNMDLSTNDQQQKIELLKLVDKIVDKNEISFKGESRLESPSSSPRIDRDFSPARDEGFRRSPSDGNRPRLYSPSPSMPDLAVRQSSETLRFRGPSLTFPRGAPGKENGGARVGRS